jgi:hypothetical protein
MPSSLNEVSMCTSVKGTCPKNAFRASHSMTVLSLPIDQSIQRRLKLLYASRMIRILVDSSSSS